MKGEVEAAIEEIARTCPHSRMLVAQDLAGGACVILEGVRLGPPYAQNETWIGFHITDACPYADVYPHFVRSDLTRLDGAPLGAGMSSNHTWPNPSTVVEAQTMPARAAIQISRRANRRDASGIETPALKLMKVLRWLLSQ